MPVPLDQFRSSAWPAAACCRRTRDTGKALDAAGLGLETSILSGQPETVLADCVEKNGEALVAMGAYGHSRIRSFVLGSTTSEILRSCKAPVVLMR
ncbi:MAG: universal stress protein [Hoeflea sp.]|uniref:universal stress protein n=1 Tax=Hoeflea sp. TaxID=1940281 RepID=UPI002730CAC8|nr:universal stress protein [Hoeflea sp.]MDP2122513.1 universal stress protein [Hoeflea sp.]